MNIVSQRVSILFFVLTSTSVVAFADDLPESITRLIDQNSMVSHRIIESPYFIEQSTAYFTLRENEVLVQSISSIHAPGERWIKDSKVFYAMNNAGTADFNKILKSDLQTTHIDTATSIVRISFGREIGALVSTDDCTDPCACKYMGNIKRPEQASEHKRLEQFAAAFVSKTLDKTITLADCIAEANDVQYHGREQFEGQWCEVISFIRFGQLREKLWLDEKRNGMILCVEGQVDGRASYRANFNQAYEVFPGQFIPGRCQNFILSYDEQSGTENAALGYERELTNLSLTPENWPNASEKDFGFRFMPYSLVHDFTSPGNPLYVIGENIDDIMFKFHRTAEFERWCDERTGRDTSASEALPKEASSRGASVSTYMLVAIGLAITAAVGGAFIFFRSQQGKASP